MTDRELLRAYRKARTSEAFRPLLERFLPFVHGASLRQTSDENQAAAVAHAAFLALARRPGSVPRKMEVAGWLFNAVRIAAGKARRGQRSTPSETPPPVDVSPEAVIWSRMAPWLDAAIGSLPWRRRDAVVARALMNRGFAETAAGLRIGEWRVRWRFGRGLKRCLRRLRRRGVLADGTTFLARCAANGRSSVIPEGLADKILADVAPGRTRGVDFALLRRTLAGLTWAKWRGRFKTALAGLGGLAVVAGLLWLAVFLTWRSGHLMAWILEFSNRMSARNHPELVQPARPWPADGARDLAGAAAVRSADDIFQGTNLWSAHLEFPGDQWKAVQPRRIPPLPGMMQSDGTFVLRNPNAKRSGLAGVLGFEFEWGHADLEFGGVTFEDVAARMKGNGTFIGSLWGMKRSFKVDFNKYKKGQKLGGIDVVNFSNLVEDRSYMADALGHELFRDAGVPAPRTAYAYLTLSVSDEFERRPLGLYLLVENIDANFAKDRFGTRDAPIFKPVTYKLFQDIGDTWQDYAAIYDLKTKATEAQQRRVVEFSKLVSHADDAEFARRAGEYLDYDEFARFLAVLTLVASYDGLFSNGQNFYVYLDPRSNRFGFLPWDLDHAWGNFPFVGTVQSRERASIWQPWAGPNRFLERVMKVEDFRKVYRERMEALLTTHFTSERLNRRIDEIADSIRSAVAAESDLRLDRFEQAVSDTIIPRWSGDPFDPKRSGHQLKRFIAARARSARDQLDGRSKGILLDRMGAGQE